MTDQLLVPRELLERVTNPSSEAAGRTARIELADLIDQPASEPKPVEHAEPMAWLDSESGAICTAMLKPMLDGFETPLFTHPAPATEPKPVEDDPNSAWEDTFGPHYEGPLAYVLTHLGEVYYETDDNIVISNAPGDELSESFKWIPVFTHPAPAGVVLPRDPSREMLDAARDWSIKKYGMGVGIDGATGCWQAMYDAETARLNGVKP